MAKRGRPTVFSPEKARIFVDLVRAGNFLSTAANAVGWGANTYREYRRQGREDIAAGLETEFSQFEAGVQTAITDSEAFFAAAARRYVSSSRLRHLASMESRTRRHVDRLASTAFLRPSIFLSKSCSFMLSPDFSPSSFWPAGARPRPSPRACGSPR